MKKRFLFILALMLIPALVACGSDKSDEEKQTKEQDEKKAEAENANKKKPLPICPQVAIVRELATLRDYGAEKPDPSQVVAAARMVNIDGDCAYPDDGGIDIEFDLNMVAQRGPRLGGNRDEFPFFTAVLDPDGNILNKNQMTTTFKFNDDPKKINDKTEHLHVFIPLDKKEREKGPGYQVLVGFQLTQAQLDNVRATADKQMQKLSPALETMTPRSVDASQAADQPKDEPKTEDKPATPDTSTYPMPKGTSPYSGTTHFLVVPKGMQDQSFTAPPSADTAPSNSTPPDAAPSNTPSSNVAPLDVTPSNAAVPVNAPPADTVTLSTHPNTGGPPQ